MYLMRICLASIVIFCAVFAPGNIEAQGTKTNLLDIPVTNFEVTNSTIGLTLQDLAYTYKVPIGVEAVYLGDGEAPPVINIKIDSGTVQDVVNAVIKLNPKYEYAEIDGVIDFFPRVKEENILDVLLRSFEPNCISLECVKNYLLATPEVSLKMKELAVQEFTISTVAPPGTQSLHSKLSLREVSVRRVLNEIAKNNNGKFWYVYRWHQVDDLISINF